MEKFNMKTLISGYLLVMLAVISMGKGCIELEVSPMHVRVLVNGVSFDQALPPAK